MADMGAFREAVTAWAATGSGDRGDRARDLAARLPVRSAVLLEGLSDAAAVDALAARRGRDLAGEGVCVLPMGGATNVGRFARLLGPAGLGLRLTGLCDAGSAGTTTVPSSTPGRRAAASSCAPRTWRTN